MMKKAMKYGFMIIAAVLLVAMAFAGAGGGALLDITADDLNVYSVINETTGNLEKTTAHGLSVLFGGKKVYLLQSVAEWTEIATNESTYNSTILIIGKNLDFSTTDSYMIPYRFNGSIYGNGYFIENFSNISNAEPNVGLIREAGNGLNLNYLRMINCSLESSNTSVGSLIGKISAGTDVAVIGCSVIDGNIKTTTNAGKSVGGLIGNAVGSNGKVMLSYSKVINTTINTVGSDSRFVGGLIGSATSLTVAYCNVTDCSVTTVKSQSGGLIGSASLIRAMGCNVLNCSVKTTYAWAWYTGGLIGRTDSSTIEKCNTVNCSVSCGYSEVGGQIGYASDVSVSHCNVVDCSVSLRSSGNLMSGGVVGRAYRTTIDTCNVTNCVVKSSLSDAGGIVGWADNTSIEHCKVADCVEISSGFSVGGILGSIVSSAPSKINDSKVINSTVIGKNIGDSASMMGGLVGSVINPDSEVNNNIIENIQIKATGGAAPQYAYLFDTTLFPINHTNGIARFAQINLANGNTIINSFVLNKTGKQSAKFDGFEGITTEFAINVSNPLITVIDEDTFKDSYLTGLFNISSVTNIGANAFAGSKLATGFYIPKSISIQQSAFSQTAHLQILYNNSSVDLTGLDANTTVFNLTKTDTHVNILPGSFPLVEIMLEPNGGNGGTSVVTTAKNSNILHSPIQLPARAGYTFFSWNNEDNGGDAVIDSTGLLQPNVAGYTGDSGIWINTSSTVTLYANWTVNKTQATADLATNTSTFGNSNYTAVKEDANTIVTLIVLNSVSNVTNTVTFTADNTSISSDLPPLPNTNHVVVSIFNINATNDGSGTQSSFNVTITLTNADDKDKIIFWHYNTTNGDWDQTPLESHIDSVSRNNVTYIVNTPSFSPFGFGIYTPIPSQYTPSSSSHSGSTVILQPGQTAPTQAPTVAPTVKPTAAPTDKPVAPTAAPTDKPVAPTVAPTANPTAQQTQQSPAPFAGLVLGLGVAAVLLRLRK